MSPHTFARMRNTVSLLILLAFFAALLPAQRASADLTIPLTRAETNEMFLKWYVEHVNKGSKYIFPERVIVSNLINNTTLPTTEMTEQLEAFNARYYKLLGPRGADPEYRESLPLLTLSRALYNAGVQTPAFREPILNAHGVLKQHADDLRQVDSIRPQDEAGWNAVARESALRDAYRTMLDEQIDKALERGKEDEEIAKVWNKYVTPGGIPIEELEAGPYLANHPEAPIPQQVCDAIRPDGSMEISLADLEQIAKTEFGKINTSIDDMQKTLVTISAQQGELVDFMKDQQKRQQAQDLAEAKAKEHQLKLEAASSAVAIVSALVGLKYPERGRQIAVVGQSLIKIHESINGWMQATAGLNTLSKIGSLSTVVMTGNILGAVMNIVSLFGPQQPTPEQIILEEIGKLRQQVNELRTEMHARFDQIDKQLNAIYTTMHDRFDQSDLQLGKITGSLEEVQQSLSTS